MNNTPDCKHCQRGRDLIERAWAGHRMEYREHHSVPPEANGQEIRSYVNERGIGDCSCVCHAPARIAGKDIA